VDKWREEGSNSNSEIGNAEKSSTPNFRYLTPNPRRVHRGFGRVEFDNHSCTRRVKDVSSDVQACLQSDVRAQIQQIARVKLASTYAKVHAGRDVSRH
jgi:hypothetical protein